MAVGPTTSVVVTEAVVSTLVVAVDVVIVVASEATDAGVVVDWLPLLVEGEEEWLANTPPTPPPTPAPTMIRSPAASNM